MSEKKIQMTQRNESNTAWDNLYPKTKAEIVEMSDGKNVEAAIIEHKAETMPHQFVDGAKTYRWGFRTKNGVAQFIIEEVI